VASLSSQLESIRASQAVASEEAAMLRANLDKVRLRCCMAVSVWHADAGMDVRCICLRGA
jgi:hypothetical protein